MARESTGDAIAREQTEDLLRTEALTIHRSKLSTAGLRSGSTRTGLPAFNVRDGPRCAIKSLITEAFGLTTDHSAYVYLSDGGHFENLGLYEAVRRRCRFIIAVDAGCDPEFALPIWAMQCARFISILA